VNPERWTRLWEAATHTVPPTDSYARLMGMYSEPHRRYHNILHIGECLGEFDRARQIATDPTAVELAIWFHDAIYDPRAVDNEERSAELAKDWLTKAHASEALADTVALLVLATKYHDASSNADAPLLVDVDLSILGQHPDRFWEYERQIREEYAWVPAGVFAWKRADVLQRFLERPRIYNTEVFHQRLETQARINLRASIEKLRSLI
jgi:predicted metal-dependent HD superfamily phosphohydrolase